MNLTDALCPACHHREHDPGSCEGCPRCELHFDEAAGWLRGGGYVVFESREALTKAMAEALPAAINFTFLPPRVVGDPVWGKCAAAIVAHLLPEADHA